MFENPFLGFFAPSFPSVKVGKDKDFPRFGNKRLSDMGFIVGAVEKEVKNLLQCVEVITDVFSVVCFD